MSILNFSDITNENRADFHSLMRTYAKELDEHQNKVTDSEALEKWTDRIIEKQHDNGWCLKLCCDGTNPIGFIFGKIDRHDDRGYKKVGYGYIMEFFVLSEHRRRGYGREMLRYMGGFFAVNGAERMYLTADPVTGVPFWERMGFVCTDEVSPENGLKIYEKEIAMKTISITVSDYLNRGLAAEIAAAQWHCAEWSDRVTSFIYDYKIKSDVFNVIARVDGEVIGRLQCFKSKENPRLWQYGDFFVKPAYRRRHIGENMLQTALEVLRDRGCRTLRCYVEPDNIVSLALQCKHGFSEKSFMPFDELINEGDLMLEKKLQSFEAAHANASDAYYVCEMYEKCIRELHGSELDGQGYRDFFNEIKEMLKQRDPDEENFLIYLGALPCGWLKLNGLESKDTGWISMLAVEPKFRRCGVGRYAVNFAVDFFETNGKKKVKIHTTEDNFPARALYESCGFSVEESYHGISGDGTERVYLTLGKNII